MTAAQPETATSGRSDRPSDIGFTILRETSRRRVVTACQDANCQEPAYCKGLCKRHYWRQKDRARSGRRRDDSLIRIRARNRAVARLIDLHPDEFADLFIEEKNAAEAEAAELAAAAEQRATDHESRPIAATSPTSSTSSRNALPVTHNAPVRLMPGPRPAGEKPADRIRPDVARCTHCHGFHDHGHRCAECGSVPKEGTG